MTSPEGVTSKLRWVESSSPSELLYNARNLTASQPPTLHLSMSSDGPHQRPGNEGCLLNSGLCGTHLASLRIRAIRNADLSAYRLLINLATPEGDCEAAFVEGTVLHV